MEVNAEHIEIIHRLFEGADRIGMPIWLESGWAIDARLGRVTREHEDIDIAYPCERHEDYLALIESLGFGRHQQEEYGFLSWRGEVLLDSECCRNSAGEYNFADYPPGSCPLAEEGTLAGRRVRCTSWSALYFEFLHLEQEIPKEQWRPKDFESLALIEAHLEENTRGELRVFHAEIA